MRHFESRPMIVALPLVAVLLAAAGPAADRDWPCEQRLVPRLTPATLWAGPVPTKDWRADPAIAALVDQVADRRLPVEDGVAKLQQFVAGKPGPEARAELFTGLVDRSNVERGAAIDRLRNVSRQLRALADAIDRTTSELDAVPEGAPAAQRDEIVNRRALMIRQYDAISRTIRYACEIPVQFEARLGRFARVLQPDQN